MLTIQYFASIREALGQSSEQLSLPEGVSTVAELTQHLALRGQHWMMLDDNTQVLIAVNQRVADRSAILHGNEEVAFFPPMTGG
ncbi:MAG: molybdopterin converting factor subunit 1 [Pseudohongiella sp.]|nr:molybdopterin converting factor subunit 1 [Pseudohongiella sp.]MDP2380527.1 molybdopterin converting factor subunit 1 [Pseudohongiella sp.]